jgi:probable addiction module antidote protein
MKKNKIKMTDFKNYEEFRRAYFEQNTEQIKEVKKEMIKEYLATPEMNVADLLYALKELLSLTNVSKIAKQTKLNREHLYKAISPKYNPTIQTVSKVANELGYRLTLIPR